MAALVTPNHYIRRMDGNPKVLEGLDEILQAELGAISTYFVHAKLQANWGYTRLSEKAYEESMDEMRHAEKLVDRIVYFDKVPNLNKIGRVKIGPSVREQFDIALGLEKAQVARINATITTCREVVDDGTRIILEPMVTAGEETVDWLETQLGAMDALGDANYLAQQLG